MVITAIKYQVRNPERANVFIDGKYAFSLTIDQIVSLSLKPGFELDELGCAELKELSVDGKLRAKAMNWITLRPRSVRETEQYLYKTCRKITDMSLERQVKNTGHILDEALNKGWLNDERFARWWLDRRVSEKKGNRQLTSELREKGIDQDIIQDLLRDRNDDSALKGLITKLQAKPKYQDREKLMRYLATKGFSYFSIVEALAAEGDGLS